MSVEVQNGGAPPFRRRVRLQFSSVRPPLGRWEIRWDVPIAVSGTDPALARGATEYDSHALPAHHRNRGGVRWCVGKLSGRVHGLFAGRDGGRAVAIGWSLAMQGKPLHVLGYRRGLMLCSADWWDVERDDPDPSTCLHGPSTQTPTRTTVRTVGARRRAARQG